MTAPAPSSNQTVTVTAAAVLAQAQITQSVSDTTSALIKSLWSRVNPYNPQQVADFVAQAGRLIVASQRTVANAAVASQLTQLRAQGINLNFSVTIPDDVRGKSVTFGRSTPKVHEAPKTVVDYEDGGDQKIPKVDSQPEKLFERAAETYRYEKSVGKDDVEANAAAEQRIDKLVDGNIMLAQRLGEQQTLSTARAKDKRVIGYRRVIHPELSKGGVCGLCVAASDRKYKIEDLKPIHHRCKCGVSPITASEDPGFALNREGLDQLYDSAGGSTSGRSLKKLRYELVDHHELGPTLVRVKGDKTPFYNTANPAPPKRVLESQADVAKRLLPGFEKSLANLRKQGLAEDSPQVSYHLKQIGRLQGDIAAA